MSRYNALGTLIKERFADPASPVRSYSELERQSGVSREAFSRYVSARPDRHRSPNIETLVAIADAMRISLEAICRAAAASVQGAPVQQRATLDARVEVLVPLMAALSTGQFRAVVEMLRQMQPASTPDISLGDGQERES